MSPLEALERIAGEAPAKEPSDGPTVGWTGRYTDAGDDFDEAMRQAFDEFYTRALWEMGQIADAAI